MTDETIPKVASKTVAARAPKAGKSAQNRSAISNGSRLFAPDTVDGRSAAARRFSDVLEQILLDLGGSDHLSELQRQLARRAAILSIQCELIEAAAVAGRDVDLELLGSLTDRLGRCASRLGLQRVAKTVKPLTILDYRRMQAEAESEGDQ